jgi:hypothetical protein
LRLQLLDWHARAAAAQRENDRAAQRDQRRRRDV